MELVIELLSDRVYKVGRSVWAVPLVALHPKITTGPFLIDEWNDVCYDYVNGTNNHGQDSTPNYKRRYGRMRNIYTIHLDADRMEYVVEKLSPTWQQTKTELLAFADFLDQLGMS